MLFNLSNFSKNVKSNNFPPLNVVQSFHQQNFDPNCVVVFLVSGWSQEFGVILRAGKFHGPVTRMFFVSDQFQETVVERVQPWQIFGAISAQLNFIFYLFLLLRFQLLKISIAIYYTNFLCLKLILFKIKFFKRSKNFKQV